jgi:hypothetical protein
MKSFSSTAQLTVDLTVLEILIVSDRVDHGATNSIGNTSTGG